MTLIDVLHHLDSFAEQGPLLDAVHRILPPGGTLVLKEVTTSRPVRYRLTRVLDRLSYPRDRFYFRPHEEFRAMLEARGFTVAFHPLWARVPYAHYAFVATEARRAPSVRARGASCATAGAARTDSMAFSSPGPQATDRHAAPTSLRYSRIRS